MDDFTEDTFIIATNIGDQTFLQFIHDRLEDRYGENPHYDYMWKLRDFIQFFKEHGQDVARLVSLKRQFERAGKKGTFIMVDYIKVEKPEELEKIPLKDVDNIMFGYTVNSAIGTNFEGKHDQLDLRYIEGYTYVRPVHHGDDSGSLDDAYKLEGYYDPQDILKNYLVDNSVKQGKQLDPISEPVIDDENINDD